MITKLAQFSLLPAALFLSQHANATAAQILPAPGAPIQAVTVEGGLHPVKGASDPLPPVHARIFDDPDLLRSSGQNPVPGGPAGSATMRYDRVTGQ